MIPAAEVQEALSYAEERLVANVRSSAGQHRMGKAHEARVAREAAAEWAVIVNALRDIAGVPPRQP